MICTFFGHKNAPYMAKELLKSAIIELVEKEDIKKFYVGNNGFFDLYVQQALEEISKSHSEIAYFIVLSQISEKAISGNQNSTIFPEGLENVPPRFAISRRNDWMIKHSDIVVAYVENSLSNTHKLVEKCVKRGLKYINLLNEV